MQSNPLIISVLDFLKNADDSVSILDIVSALNASDTFRSLAELPCEMIAFRKNFLVMNALYFLQRDLMGSGYALSISAMSIRLEPVAEFSNASALVEMVDDKLSDYYLDWENYHETGPEEVEQLLNDFWQLYQARDKRLAALTVLGLAESADWQQVQQAYRRLISQCHPDKGGDQQLFIEIREAYEILAYCFKV